MITSDYKFDECEALLEGDQEDGYQGKRASWMAFARSYYIVFIAFIFIFSTVLLSSSSAHSAIAAYKWQIVHPTRVTLPHVYTGIMTHNRVNSTLGFQKIMALNLPQRMDKKDELTLMGYASDIQIDFLATRTMSDLDPKGLPHHAAFPTMAILAAWRAHADAWEHIVSNRIATALILEDDTDWDVNIKKQIQRLQQPFATLLQAQANDSTPRVSTRQDPWMHQDWDVIYLGYCLESAFTQQMHPPDVNITQAPHVLYDDDTLADRKHTDKSMLKYMDHYGYHLPSPDNVTFPMAKRVVTRSNSPVCNSAYAVTLKGASKLLYHTSRERMEPADLSLAQMIMDGKIRSYQPMPPIMGQWKIKDGGLKNSDTMAESIAGDTSTNKNLNHNPTLGSSYYVRDSVRSLLKEVLSKRRNIIA